MLRRDESDEEIVVKWFKNKEQQREELLISDLIREKIKDQPDKYFVLVQWSGESWKLAKNPSFSPITQRYQSYNVTNYEPLGDLITYLLSNGKSLTYPDQFQLAFSAVQCLVKLHQVDIAHCDLKPDNMVVVRSKDSGFGIKLIDFAFSRECAKDLIKTQKGTFNYMPPEQLMGELVDLKKSDIYSLGVVLYIIFNLLPPYSHKTTS